MSPPRCPAALRWGFLPVKRGSIFTVRCLGLLPFEGLFLRRSRPRAVPVSRAGSWWCQARSCRALCTQTSRLRPAVR